MRTLGLILLVTVLYTVFGYIGLLAAIPPGYATVIWVPAGIAIAAVWIWGYRVLFGVFMGSVLVNLLTTWQLGQVFSISSILGCASIGLGAGLHAFIAVCLLRRILGKDTSLLYARDILTFAVIVGPVASIVSALWGNLSLLTIGSLAANDFFQNALTWWVGDSIGGVIIAPLILILLSKPKAVWRVRVVPIVLPMVLCFTVVMTIFLYAQQHERARVEALFSKQVVQVINQVKGQVLISKAVTESLAAFIEATPNLNKEQFDQYANTLLSNNHYIQAAEWAPEVTDLKKHLKHARKQGMANYNVSTIAKEYKSLERYKVRYPILYVSPIEGNEAAHGFDLGSHKGRLNSVLKSKMNKHAVMSAPINLVQTKHKDKGLLIMAPVHKQQRFIGIALMVLNMQNMIANVLEKSALLQHFSLFDVQSTITKPTLVFRLHKGSSVRSSFTQEVHTQIMGRTWKVVAKPSNAFLANVYTWHSWYVFLAGSIFCVLISVVLFIVYGQRHSIELTIKKRTQELRAIESQNALILESAGEGIYGLNVEGMTTFVNPAALKMLGYQAHELLGESMHQMVHHTHPDGSPYDSKDCPMYAATHDGKVHHMENEVLWRKDGSYFWVEYTSTPIIQNGVIEGAVVVFTDISEQRESQINLKKMALTDSLTGLPNRFSFLQTLERAVENSGLKSEMMAVCYIDLDNFKQVNDTLGHGVGDELLIKVANMVKGVCREHDYLARLSGDEFALIMCSIANHEEAVVLAKRLVKQFACEIDVVANSINTSISLGIATFPDAGTTPEILLKNADMAMYQAKGSGKNTYAFYDERVSRHVQRRHDLDTQLRKAIELNEFEVFYQPIADAKRSNIVGFEALLRWNNHVLGSVNPEEFIHVAEDNGLIYAIGDFVFDEILKAYPKFELQYQSEKPLMLSINVSVKQLEQDGFADDVIARLAPLLKQQHNVILEVTESALMRNPEQAYGNMVQLAKEGLHFSLDDFGVGHSSMQYIKSLPISHIKIDQSFVRDVLVDKDDAAIIDAIVQLTHVLGMRCVAEGVETQLQAHYLKETGVELLQGYYFSVPVNLKEALALLKPNDENDVCQ